MRRYLLALLALVTLATLLRPVSAPAQPVALVQPSDIGNVLRHIDALRQRLQEDKLNLSQRLGPLKLSALDAAERHGVDPQLVAAVIEQESGWRADLVHTNDDLSRDYGLMQLSERTWPWLARQVGIENPDPLDPAQNLDMGVWFLAYLNRQYGPDLDRVLTSYNRGEAGARAWTVSRGTARSAYSEAVLSRPR